MMLQQLRSSTRSRRVEKNVVNYAQQQEAVSKFEQTLPQKKSSPFGNKNSNKKNAILGSSKGNQTISSKMDR